MTEKKIGMNRENLSPREIAIERWKNAPMQVHHYPAGKVTDLKGNTYEYSQGARLGIGDQLEVMDSCQRPWIKETVRLAFKALGPRENVRVLERGFGMGLIAGRIMDYLRLQGGSYTVMELNKQVAEFVQKKWIPKQIQIEETRTTSMLGGRFEKSNVIFELIKGDAVEETQKLAKSGRKFDIIVSDTYPLSENEGEGMNDLVDLETLVRCLDPKGVFAFFGFHTGSTGSLGPRQRNMVGKYFNDDETTFVTVNPPPDYKYFNPLTGPVRRLPVIICKKPRLQTAA